MRIIRYLGLFLAGLLTLGTITAFTLYQAAIGGWFIEKQSPDELWALLEPHIEISMPKGDGPFPAFLHFHGCGGSGSASKQWAAFAVEQGFAAIIIDSNKPRGYDFDRALKEICSGQALLGAERAGDIVVALDFVRRLNKIDPTQIVLMGASHGAWTVMDMMALNPPDELPTSLNTLPQSIMRNGLSGVVGLVLFYPYCGIGTLTDGSGWATSVKSVFVLAENDTVVDTPTCVARARGLRDAGIDVDMQIMHSVNHGFDIETLDSGVLQYAPKAHEKSKDLVATFLAEIKRR